MSPERWAQIEEIFHRARERPNERDLLLAEANPEVRHEVESLLAQGRIQFLDSGILDGQGLLPSGTTFGRYRIESLLGAGGMGEVYRAKDTLLEREVALKLLAHDRLSDAERCRRFLQEARAVSTLNHPNIVGLYDMGSLNGRDFLVMEYVTGEPLDRLIPDGGLPVAQMLGYAIQIADALIAAHAAGVIHRDLKPANIMVTARGTVKLLDFGLAKLIDGNPTAEDAVAPQTRAGMILGTLCYLSPEQAEGKATDVRSDLFSFGCVVYEMLTGQRAFRGDSPASIVSAILRDEPKPARELRRAIPEQVDRTVRLCLHKAPNRRFQHAADLKIALLEIREEMGRGAQPRWHRFWTTKAAIALLLPLRAATLILYLRSSPTEPPLAVTPLTTFPGYELDPALSPDGNQVAFEWEGEGRDNSDIYAEVVGNGDPLRLTTDPARDHSPAWSPDGRRIAFLRELPNDRAAVMLIPALGGAEQKVAETLKSVWERTYYGSRALTWTPDGKGLVITDQASPGQPLGLFLLVLETREKRRLTAPKDPARADRSAAFSPDGRQMLFSRNYAIQSSDIYLLPLTSDLRPKGEPKSLTSDHRWNDSPTWLDAGRQFVFSSNRDGTRNLWRMAVRGERTLQKVQPAGEDATSPAISRYARRLVYVQQHQDVNIWSTTLTGTTEASGPPAVVAASTRLDSNPDFSPDGQQFTFHSDRSGSFEIWTSDSNGLHPRQLTFFGHGLTGSPRWSPDGRWISFDSGSEGKFAIYIIPAEGGRPKRLTDLDSENNVPTWSHDSRWIYFTSERSGQPEVWKMPSQGGSATQVTRGGAQMAVESNDGRTLYILRGILDARRTLPVSLWRMPSEGGQEQKLIDAVALRNFAVSERGIYYECPQRPSGWTLRFLNFVTGKETEIGRYSKLPYLGLSLSPDRRTLLFSQIDHEGSDLMDVENIH